MIFVSVGTQLPFERLIKSVDQWSEQHAEVNVFAQIGDSQYRPKYMEYVEKLSPMKYAEQFDRASLVISHVGMGTIIRGLECAKPMILMPRLVARGEIRSDHQLGTAEKFRSSGLIDIVATDQELSAALARRLGGSTIDTDAVGGAKISPELLAKLRAFVSGE